MTPHLDGRSLHTEAVGDVLGADRVTGHVCIMDCNPRVDKCRPRDYNGSMTTRTIPSHQHVPACRFHFCNVCTVCERVHHAEGPTCITCATEQQPTAQEVAA